MEDVSVPTEADSRNGIMEVATIALGSTWRTMILMLDSAQRARRADIVEVAGNAGIPHARH